MLADGLVNNSSTVGICEMEHLPPDVDVESLVGYIKQVHRLGASEIKELDEQDCEYMYRGMVHGLCF